jgi:hypothetical protein
MHSVQLTSHQFHSSSSSCTCWVLGTSRVVDLVCRGGDCDLESGVMTLPRTSCESPSSSSNETVFGDFCDTLLRDDWGTADGLEIDDAGDPIGNGQTFMSDCDMSEISNEARF